MNLKLILMELGNRLVTVHGYTPTPDKNVMATRGCCQAIADFTEWVNEWPEAQQVIADLTGDPWPVLTESETEKARASIERLS